MAPPAPRFAGRLSDRTADRRVRRRTWLLAWWMLTPACTATTRCTCAHPCRLVFRQLPDGAAVGRRLIALGDAGRQPAGAGGQLPPRRFARWPRAPSACSTPCRDQPEAAPETPTAVDRRPLPPDPLRHHRPAHPATRRARRIRARIGAGPDDPVLLFVGGLCRARIRWRWSRRCRDLLARPSPPAPRAGRPAAGARLRERMRARHRRAIGAGHAVLSPASNWTRIPGSTPPTYWSSPPASRASARWCRKAWRTDCRWWCGTCRG